MIVLILPFFPSETLSTWRQKLCSWLDYSYMSARCQVTEVDFETENRVRWHHHCQQRPWTPRPQEVNTHVQVNCLAWFKKNWLRLNADKQNYVGIQTNPKMYSKFSRVPNLVIGERVLDITHSVDPGVTLDEGLDCRAVGLNREQISKGGVCPTQFAKPT